MGERNPEHEEHQGGLRRWLARDNGNTRSAAEWQSAEQKVRLRRDRAAHHDDGRSHENDRGAPGSGHWNPSQRDEERRRADADWQARERSSEHDWRDELGMSDFHFGRQARHYSPHAAGDHPRNGSAGDGRMPQRPAETLHLDWERSARLREDYGDYGHEQDDRYRAQAPSAGNWLAHPQGDNAMQSRHGGTWATRGGPGVRRQARPPRGYVRSDERIREDICECLMTHPYVDASDVSVEVRGGVVHLEGSVAERDMRYALESVAAGCMGVQDVENRVRVGKPADDTAGTPHGLPQANRGAASATAAASGAAQSDGARSPSAQDAGLANASVSDTHGLGSGATNDTSRFIRPHTD